MGSVGKAGRAGVFRSGSERGVPVRVWTHAACVVVFGYSVPPCKPPGVVMSNERAWTSGFDLCWPLGFSQNKIKPGPSSGYLIDVVAR